MTRKKHSLLQPGNGPKTAKGHPVEGPILLPENKDLQGRPGLRPFPGNNHSLLNKQNRHFIPSSEKHKNKHDQEKTPFIASSETFENRKRASMEGPIHLPEDKDLQGRPGLETFSWESEILSDETNRNNHSLLNKQNRHFIPSSEKHKNKHDPEKTPFIASPETLESHKRASMEGPILLPENKHLQGRPGLETFSWHKNKHDPEKTPFIAAPEVPESRRRASIEGPILLPEDKDLQGRLFLFLETAWRPFPG
ncbi:hypothetical protein CDAR_451151 [Caerostris darwini]|uniref:Prolactin receptor n=1 Tax=Caerostris darwini TaxID=1538125 RepID=A0AAV4PU93_9ARAC|nr:hypothetical protein CDAR_451151 [Caerostris darwini]